MQLIKIEASLILLNENALKADLNVPGLSLQKLIKKKEVKPISSQPKKKIIMFPALTKINMLKTKEFINDNNLFI